MVDQTDALSSQSSIPASVRLRIMLQLLQKKGLLTMQDVMDTFKVARATAQRDLDKLCEAQYVQRIRGGVLLSDKYEASGDIVDFSIRRKINPEKKSIIAEAAVNRLQGSSTLYLDAGTTAVAVAETLACSCWRPLWVVTNSWHVAEILGKAGIRHELLGGEVDYRSLAISGPTAIETLTRYHFDWAVLSCDAITSNGSIRLAHPPEAHLKRVAIKNSTKSMLLASHDKFGQTSHIETATLADFDICITDALIDEITSLCNQLNVELVIAEH